MTTKNEQDPTNQSANRTKANRDNNRRLNKSAKEVLALWKHVPAKRVVKGDIKNNADYYKYSGNITLSVVQAIIDKNLETKLKNRPKDWYFNQYVSNAYRSGFGRIDNQIEQVVLKGLNTNKAKIPFTSTRFYKEQLRIAQSESYRLLKKLSRDTANQVMQMVSDGISAGLSKRDIAKQIAERFDVSLSSSQRIVNTEINKTYNNGAMDAVDAFGKNMGVMHISALLATTRFNHGSRNGHVYTTQAQRRWWDSGTNRINCFIPGTKVSGRFKGGLKSFYSGIVIKLMTRNGRDITVTPNHKIMTNRGLITAAKIRKGDNLIAHKVETENSSRIADLNVNEVNPRIEDVFTSLSKIGYSSMIRPMSVDFDGYERFINKDIDRVFVEGELTFTPNPSVLKDLDYFSLKHSDPSSVRGSSFYQRLSRIFTTPTRNISSISNFFCVPFRCLFKSIKLPFATCAVFNTRIPKHSTDNRSGNVEGFSNSEYRLPINMVFDDIVSIEVKDFSGHVYDLQERSGLMIANNLIVSNCHCSIKAVAITPKNEVVDKVGQQKQIKKGRDFFEDKLNKRK